MFFAPPPRSSAAGCWLGQQKLSAFASRLEQGMLYRLEQNCRPQIRRALLGSFTSEIATRKRISPNLARYLCYNLYSFGGRRLHERKTFARGTSSADPHMPCDVKLLWMFYLISLCGDIPGVPEILGNHPRSSPARAHLHCVLSCSHSPPSDWCLNPENTQVRLLFSLAPTSLLLLLLLLFCPHYNNA